MLRTLIASRRLASRSLRASTVSVGMHAAVVLAAVAATWPAARPPLRPVPLDTAVVIIPEPERPGAVAPEPPEFDVLDDFSEIPKPPDSTIQVVIPGARLAPDTGVGAGPPARDGSTLVGQSEGVTDGDMADELPELLVGPPPRYPELLRVAGISGRVVVEAVVDSSGRAEPASLRVVASPHPGFDAVALAYVRGAVFRPGRMLGRAVRVRVRALVEFRLTR